MKTNIKNQKTLAELANIHDLYQKAVQAPEADIEFFDKTYTQLRGRKALVMREDFCGTALLSVEWCKNRR